MATFIHPLLATTGRVLLGLYFILPGISKILGWDNTAALMTEKGMVLVPVFLALTIVLQIGGGLALALGFCTKLIAFVLAGHVPVVGEILTHESGWRLEVTEGDERRVMRLRLHAPIVHMPLGK